MPSGKPREFDDTWKKDELERTLKDSRRHKDREKEHRKHRDEEDDKRHRRKEDGEKRRHRDKENGDSESRDKHRSSRHKDEDNENERDGSRRHDENDDREKRHRRRDENGEQKDAEQKSRRRDEDDRERRHRKHREDDEGLDDDDRERRHRRHRDENDDGEKKHRKHREDETEEERRKRKERERQERGERGDDRERRHRSDREKDDRERRHRSDREKDDRERRHRSDREKDDDRERRHRSDREKDEDRERRHRSDREKDDDRERRHRSDREKDDDRERRHRSDRDKRDDDEDERRKRHEEKRRREKEKERQERDAGREKENERQRERDREREREMEREQEKQRERERRREKEREERERKKKEKEEKEEEKEEEDEYGDYEDDFEDYDDDFEDEEEETDTRKPPPKVEGQHSTGYYKSLDWDIRSASRADIDEVKRAMDEENDRLLRESRQKYDEQSDDSFEEYKPQRRRYDDDDEPKKSWGRPKTAQRTFINFTSAKQRHLTSQVASKARRRGIELSQIIELDIAKFDLFDMPPVSEYELYMRTFGGSNTKQAYIQTNEDNIEREIQTEDIETREKWSQHPPEELECVGGPEEEKSEKDDLKPIDQVKLGKFLKHAAQTMIYLIEEDRLSSSSGERREQKSDICLSEAFAELETKSLPLLKGRHVTCGYFSPVQSQMLLTVYSESGRSDKGSEHNSGVVCVWNVNEPQAPQKVLMCESRPRCCCFSPIKSHLAFAGMHDGSLAIWDLRESSAMHRSVDGWTYRFPTYSTAGVLQYDNHQSPVIAIQPVVTQAESSVGGLPGNAEGEGLNFQLISLEEHSTINLWVVAEIGHPDTAGSQSELGLSPGGRVKLIKSSVINLQNPLRDSRLRSTMRSYTMQLLPSNNSHFYVTTNVGCVLHGVRYGGKAPPRVYWTEETESLSKITSIDFSPFSEPVFLTGSEDGTLRLHHKDCDYALVTWPNATQGVPIQCVRWCRSRPSVFFVLDDRSRMHIWDLFMSDADAMKYEQIAQERVVCFELSNDHSATGQGMPGRKPQMVVCLESGASEVHTVSREFSALMPDEIQQFSQLILSFT